MALTIWGTTVSSYPTMPGKMAPPWRNFAIKLSRISSFTRRVLSRCSVKALWRNSPSVRGRLMMETPGRTVSEADYTPSEEFKNNAKKRELMNVAVSAGFLPHPHGSPQIRQDRLKIGNYPLHTLRFRLHGEQGLLEIEIQRKGSNQVEGEL